MPGSSDYNVLLKATIQKITQADLDKATAGLKVNVSSKGASELNNSFKEVEATNKSITKDLGNNVSKVMQWGIATSAVYGSLQEIRKAMEYLVALNKEMTNIGLVSGQTQEELAGTANQYNQMAKELGTTTLEMAQGAVSWIRQGKSAEETTKLLTNSTMLAKLGNMDAVDATSKMTAVLNAYNMTAEDSINIVDSLVN
jgi:Xaa-Pro aminopeptidase